MNTFIQYDTESWANLINIETVYRDVSDLKFETSSGAVHTVTPIYEQAFLAAVRGLTQTS